MAGGQVVVLQRVHDLDGGHGAKIAIEVAAAGNGINVGAEEDGLERGVAALAQSGEVTGGINTGINASDAHQVHSVLAAGDIGVRVSDAADAIGEGAASRTAVDTKAFQVLLQAGSINAQSSGVFGK
jgi:hypothetical protein